MDAHQSIKAELKEYFSRYKKLTFKKKELILRPGQEMSQVYFIKAGAVRQYSVTKNGDEFTLNIFKPGSMLFLIQMLQEHTNRHYYQALIETEVYVAPFSHTLTYLQTKPMITLNLLQQIGVGINGYLARIESLTFNNSREKLATILLILAKRFGKKENGFIRVELPLTHYDLSCLIGVTRETTSIEMKKMEREGLISRDKQLTYIYDLDKITELATVVPD